MRTTTVLCVKQLISKLHPPLSPTPRQASQLQTVLLASFQRNLDQAYPSPRSSDGSTAGNGTDEVAELASSPSHAANYHVQSILNHPFIDQRSDGGLRIESHAARAVSMFEKAVLNGTVDAALLGSCAFSYRRSLEQNSNHRPVTKLGPKIAAWLAASTAAVREDVLVRSSYMDPVVTVMYYDETEGAVWEWLRMLLSGDFGPGYTSRRFDKRSYGWLTTEDLLVSYMLRETARRHGIAAAVQEYVEACEYRIRSGRIVAGEVDCDYQPLYNAGGGITADILDRRGSHRIPEHLYDRLLQFRVPAYKNNLTAKIALWPILPVYHPTRPTADELYISLTDPGYVKTLLSHRTLKGSGHQQGSLLFAVLRGANLLLEAGEEKKAQFVLTVARESFPDALKPNTPPVTAEQVQQACNDIVLQPMPNFAIT